MQRANTSMTKATDTKPCPVETEVKSETHSAFGRSAWSGRLTRSSGQGAALLLNVVRDRFAAYHAFEPHLLNQPLHRGAGHVLALAL